MGSGGKGGGSGSKVYDYFGTLAGAVCAGPVDELVAIICDGKTVWPSATLWKTGTVYAVNDLVGYQGGVFKCTTGHTSNSGNVPPSTSYWTRYTVTRTGSPNPLPLSVEGYGAAYFYWGTDTQTLDSTGEATLSTNGHPNYRRQSVLVLKDFLFGRERTSAPNVEVIVRKKPKQTVVTGTSANLADGQANPIAALADIYTDPVFGAGLSTAGYGTPDPATWQAAADALQANATKACLSPLLNSAGTLRQFTGELLAYCDAWVRFNGAGSIEAGTFPHNVAPPTFTPETTIDFHDLIDEVSYSADGWSGTYNQSQVTFKDRDRAFKDGSVSSVSGSNLAVTGEPRTARVDRPWITRRQQASDYAAEWLKINAEPVVKGTLVVRAEKAESILPGDMFLLTHDALSVSMTCRCTSKDLAQPPAGRATIGFESDRASAPPVYQPTANPGATAEYPSPELLSLRQLFQPLPSMVDGSDNSSLALLVARKSPITVSASVWLRKSDVSGFYQLGTARQFAIAGTLQTSYAPATTLTTASRARTSNVATITTSAAHGLNAGQTVIITGLSDSTFTGSFSIDSVPTSTSFTFANTGSNVSTTTDTGGTVLPAYDDVTEALRVTLDTQTNAADLAKMLTTQTEDSIDDVAICVVVFDQSDAKNFEVMALRNMRIATGESFYRLKVRRYRFGSKKRNGVTGDQVFIAYRSDLVAFSSASFETFANAGSSAVFRLQAANSESVADLSDAAVCPDISYTFADTFAPGVTWTSIKANGSTITDFSTNYTTSTVFSVLACVADATNGLTESRLYATRGTETVPLWGSVFNQSTKAVVETSFSLPTNGEWNVFLSVKDSTGRLRNVHMIYSGSPVTLKIGVGTGSAQVANPVCDVPSGAYKALIVLVTLSCSTPGSTIKYAWEQFGAESPSIFWTTYGWITYTGPFFFYINQPFGTRFFVYAEKSGATTSDTVKYDWTSAGTTAY